MKLSPCVKTGRTSLYNQHPKDIGEEKAGQLSDTDVLAEKFPNKFVH
jgi:hypothetical protein